MEKITSRKKLLIYGCSGLGVNMLNIIVGSYLCSALLTGGFVDDVENWTYLNKDLVVAGIWGVLVLVAKVLDGLIDIPFSSFTDNLKTKWGRRRPAILIGYIPMLIAYVLFLVPIDNGATVLNTVWFAVMLCIFYAFYTLTMLTYYATFSEIVTNERDMLFLSNTKSICDVIYFSIGFALVPLFVTLGMNIRIVALIMLPLALTMLIPLFLLKEEPTDKRSLAANPSLKRADTLTLAKAVSCSFKNKSYIIWMFTAGILMNFGVQLFLSGINELFSTTGLNMTVVMASSFAPVPITIIAYNKIVKRFGLGTGYRFVLAIFAFGMLVTYICNRISPMVSQLTLTLIAAAGGVVIFFALGAFFSVAYTVPSHLAAKEKERTGASVASMYFAVQGLFEGFSAGMASGVVLVYLKDHDCIAWLPIIVIIACAAAFIMSFTFPDVISKMGKEQNTEVNYN